MICLLYNYNKQIYAILIAVITTLGPVQTFVFGQVKADAPFLVAAGHNIVLAATTTIVKFDTN
jgi:hypothetical protein